MILRPLLLAIVAALTAAAPAVAQTSTLVGAWKSPTRGGVIAIAVCGATVCGKLVDGDDLRAVPDATDIRNRNAALRARPLKGLLLLQGFTGGPERWVGGTVYNPDDGGTYSGAITRIDADHLRLKGCIIFPFCKTEVWTRVR